MNKFSSLRLGVSISKIGLMAFASYFNRILRMKEQRTFSVKGLCIHAKAKGEDCVVFWVIDN